MPSGTQGRTCAPAQTAFSDGVVGYAASKQRSVLTADLHKDAREPEQRRSPAARSCMVVPIISDGQTVGCVQLVAAVPNYYSAEQLGLMARLMSLAAVGVRNAILHSRTLAMADIDGLATYPELPATGHAVIDGVTIVSVNCMLAMLKLPNLSWHIQVETANIGGAVQQAVNALLAGVCT